MSYALIRVYEFTCDHPACSHTETLRESANQRSDALITLAHRDLRKKGWTAQRYTTERRWEHLCPAHKWLATTPDEVTP